MKNNKALKIFALIFTISLCVGVLFSVNAFAENDSEPKIVSQNVMYNEKFCLMYAVDASTVVEAPVKLYLYEQSPADGASPVKVYETSTITPAKGNLTLDCYIFTTDGVAAYAMAQNFYVQAVDAKGNASEVKRYSVGEYLYERLASDDVSEKQRVFYGKTLEFGAGAQKIIAKETDETKYINNFCYVKSLDGTLVDGYTGGIFSKGSNVTIAKSGEEKWTAISYAADGGYTTKIITDGSYTIPSNAVSVELNAGQRIVYRDSSMTFEDKTDGEDDYTYFSKNSGTVRQYVYEEGRGMVLMATMSKADAGIYTKNIDTSIASKEEATAFEFSFDIKMNFDPLNTASRQYIIPAVRFDGASKRITRIGMGHNPNKTNFGFVNPKSGNEIQAIPDVDYSDWFHVRIVYYEGDTNGYVYINGTDTPFVLPYSGGGGSSGYTGDISLIDRVDFLIENTDSLSTIYIDNVFCGFTKDTIQMVE